MSKSPWHDNNASNVKQNNVSSIKNFKNSFNPEQPYTPKKSHIILLVIILLALWIGSGFYRVQPSEEGIELTFGEWTNRENTARDGLHYHYPYPIGEVLTPNITKENKIDIGFISDSAGNLRSYIRSSRNNQRLNVQDVAQESTMLTGDENIVDIDFVVFWRVKSGGDYLFNIKSPDEAIKLVAESSMREEIGQSRIKDALTERRRSIETNVISRMQNMLDSYGAGVLIKDVKLLDVAPPEPVVDAFNDVQRARADEERKRNEAEAYSKSIIPKARGEAEQIIQQAKGYAAEVTNQAQGEAERFESVLRQYNNSKDITRTRLYIEAMEEVMSVANKTIIGGETAQNVLPYLPLSKGLKGGNN